MEGAGWRSAEKLPAAPYIWAEGEMNPRISLFSTSLQARMTTKAQLAASIGGGYPFFRKQLREMEKQDLEFNTGRNKYLTELQELRIRAHYKALKTVSI